jgi:hypothetical protein
MAAAVLLLQQLQLWVLSHRSPTLAHHVQQQQR